MSKRVLIVGGGTAGWMTALFVKKVNPSLTVELIESEKIGVLGAGESAPTVFNSILDTIGITSKEFITKTEATLKSSVRFDSWLNPESSYLSTIHPTVYNFSPFKQIRFPTTEDRNIADFYLFCYVNNIDINTLGTFKFAIKNKAPYVFLDGKLQNVTSHTYHINAKLTAQYFRKLAEERGIIRHEGKVVKINGHYPIESIEDDKGRVHKVDFVFDCSGFARIIIGKHFNTEWLDYTKHLTVNSAIPFFLPMEKEIPPYTKATAMKYGWMFKVPTRNRYGSGYVYNSDLISKEQAIEELHEKLGHDVELVNHFNFRGGMYKEALVSNCIGLGLAGSFLEPMSATNIGTISVALNFLFQHNKISTLEFDDAFIKRFNDFIHHYNQQRMSEIFMHYVTEKNDSPFWEHYKNQDNFPPLFKKAYDESFSDGKFDWRHFSLMTDTPGHASVPKMVGNGWFRQNAMEYCKKYKINEQYRPIYEYIKQQTDILFPYAVDHREYLESL